MANSAPDDLLVDEDVDLNEESFVIKSKPKKIKNSSQLLSGFCLEAAIPVEEGRNVDTKGIIVGKSSEVIGNIFTNIDISGEGKPIDNVI